MSEQRRNTRLECLVPVDGKQGSLFDHTKTVDLSKGGMGFLSDHKIPLEQEIMVELDLDKKGPPVFVIGKVKWVRRVPESGMYRVGLSFVEVVQGSKSRLDKYFSK